MEERVRECRDLLTRRRYLDRTCGTWQARH